MTLLICTGITNDVFCISQTLCNTLVFVASQLSDTTFLLVGITFSGLSTALVGLIRGLYDIIDGLEDAVVPLVTSFFPVLNQVGIGDVATSLSS